MKPRVKQLTAADAALLEACAALEAVCIPGEAWSLASFRAETEKPGGCVLAALDAQDGVLGFVTACCVLDEGEITNVAVSPLHRREGTASLLLRALVRMHPGCRFFLEVRASNKAALALYEKHGFSRVGLRRRFYAEPCEDAVVMAREPVT